MKIKNILTKKYIISAFKLGKWSRDISKETGINDRTIRWYFRKYGLIVPRWKPHKVWNKGIKAVDDERIKRFCDAGHKARRGKSSWNKGKHHSEKTKKKIRDWLKNNLTEAQKKGLDRTGCVPWNFKGNKDWENQKIRHSKEHKQWALEVYKKDKYHCKSCKKHCERNGIVAHHIKSFSQYPELRFEVNNGITLCRKCHILLHRKIIKLATW